jgi:hypothetical protein
MTHSVALPTLYRVAVRSFSSGQSAEMVLNYLIEKGLPESYARNLMAVALTESRHSTEESVSRASTNAPMVCGRASTVGSI